MKEKIRDLLTVILMMGSCILCITFVCKFEGRAIPSDKITTPPPVDTIAPVPNFMQKTAKEGLNEALTYYDIQCPSIVYAQAVLETGNFKSVGCLKHNNLFGLYNSRAKRYCRFNHWTESVVAYKEWIQRRYKPPEDYYHFLNRIGYARDPGYIHKLKQIVNSNDKRRSLGGSEGYS